MPTNTVTVKNKFHNIFLSSLIFSKQLRAPQFSSESNIFLTLSLLRIESTFMVSMSQVSLSPTITFDWVQHGADLTSNLQALALTQSYRTGFQNSHASIVNQKCTITTSVQIVITKFHEMIPFVSAHYGM